MFIAFLVAMDATHSDCFFRASTSFRVGSWCFCNDHRQIDLRIGFVSCTPQTNSRDGEMPPEILDLIRRLSTDLDDTQIARVLSRRGLRTATGLTFTKRRVQSVRACHNIPCPPRAPAGERVYTAEEAAREMGVSGATIHEWIRAGVLHGKQLTEGAPWRIVLDEQTRRRLNGSEAPPGWVGIEEAARRLGVSKQTVVTWVKQGKLQAVRATVGRRAGWKIQAESTDLAKQRQLC